MLAKVEKHAGKGSTLRMPCPMASKGRSPVGKTAAVLHKKTYALKHIFKLCWIKMQLIFSTLKPKFNVLTCRQLFGRILKSRDLILFLVLLAILFNFIEFPLHRDVIGLSYYCPLPQEKRK